ncbi:MAG: protein translocase subunit SecD [Chlamydiia bacterium]|nr:protein translocase subunit SecD [Chlamydiia bacterium]
MEKRKRWQLFLILGVIVLTIYNILPTIFFYAKPLKRPVGEKEAMEVASKIAKRVNDLEGFTLSWLKAQSKNLKLTPLSIALDPDNPRLAKVTFRTPEDARFFSETLHRAGSLIPFVPAQLSPSSGGENSTTVTVLRRIGVHLDEKNLRELFTYIPKENEQGELTQEYRNLVSGRALQLALGFGGQSNSAAFLLSLEENSSSQDEEMIRLCRAIVEYENVFGDTNPLTQRYFSSFSQIESRSVNRTELISNFISRQESLSSRWGAQIAAIEIQKDNLKNAGGFLSSNEQQKLETLHNQKGIVEAATQIVKRNVRIFEAGKTPITLQEVKKALSSDEKVQIITIGDRNPFVETLRIDYDKETIDILLHQDILVIRDAEASTEQLAIEQEKLDQLLFNEIAQVARNSDETISPSLNQFSVSLNELINSSSFLALDIGEVAKLQSHTLQHLLTNTWSPSDGELTHLNYPVYDYATYEQLPAASQKLGLVIFAPILMKNPPEGFRNSSIYVIGRGLEAMIKNYTELPDSAEKSAFEKDLASLEGLMRQNGFISYSAASAKLPSSFHQDLVFELDDYYSYLLAATRENFSVLGHKENALLEFTDLEQRILTENKIDTLIHEDLVKWRDEYQAANVSLVPQAKYDVPKPTKNVFLSNMKLSTIKYFRGDNRKILKWGLDLSGGKTVRLGLKDKNNQHITDEADLRQAVNELYGRVNKLGVSEVGIRTEGSTIVLDFPGSQGLSASELIQASAMYFNVVNEKFTANHSTLAEAVNTFLEEVWNEAVITNRTDAESLGLIAWKHLGGNPDNPLEFSPLSSHAQLLYANGLRLAGPGAPIPSSQFDDTLSTIARYRGRDFADWQGQTYPLLIVFHNYALEGADLTDVQTAYDTSEGNILNFAVGGVYTKKDGEKINPREDFFAWTSQFSEEKIVGTPKEEASGGRGWRMAVILNGTVISAPVLNAPLRDQAKISGHFSQREINQLAADLKAGSLSFTPYILSEENISPDLGKEQRTQGIFAAAFGLFLVIMIMCSYYRFAGVVASIAVVFNLLIIWAVLQNLGATLTLPGIAGIILTIGMSVDANVLVFERIREEFSLSGRLPSAVQAGYRKAFSAIIDSNLTTILAAIILLNFDSGPVKGLALTLVIGILSSMLTALFMTRFFFAGWVQNPKNKILKMAKIFGKTSIDFLKRTKITFLITALIFLVGVVSFISKKQTLFGMDFTGGYSLSVTLRERDDTNYRLAVGQALEAAGAASSDFQIRELNKPYQLRIQLGTSMELPGKPFYGIDEEIIPKNPMYNYQDNPRIVWIVGSLEKGGLEINPTTLSTLELSWTEMSGQLSDTMRNSALIGLGLALVGILLYITFRFEFKFAISATLALAHDLLLTVSLLSIIHFFFEGVQIDLQVIAALLTIVGYSLNDTIIIFDRVREDVRLMRKMKFDEIINLALNSTLSRTMMTSTTTIVVLLALVVFGGASVFNFSLVMTIGVAIGTLSSLYIASPLLLFFHKKELERLEESKSQ